MAKFTRTLILAALVLIMASPLFAASSVTETESAISEGMYVRELSVIAHTSGAVTSYTTATPIDGIVYMVETVPGVTTPTNLYDLTLVNEASIDIMGGNIGNRSASVAERAMPLNYQAQPIKGKLTLTVSGNSVNGARFKVRIYIFR